MGKQFPNILTVYKTAADGARVAYRYHRPTSTRLYAELGTPEFAIEYERAANPTRQKLKTTRLWAVYFIRARALGLIKIGRTQDVAKRLVTMQTGSPDHLELLAVVDDPTGALEAELHARFAKHRRHGEWFDPAPRLLRYLADLQRRTA